jgi:hypothetical protein
MRRGFSTETEVVWRPDQSFAEVGLPDPIHDHPGGERILGARQPLGQFQTSTPIGADRRHHPGVGHADEPPWDRILSRVQVTATDVDREIDRLVVLHRQGEGCRGRRPGLHLVPFPFQHQEPLPDVGGVERTGILR